MSNKKFLYFQKDDLNKKSPTDSVLRTYSISEFDYKLQPQDVVSIRFQSLTDKNFDFFNQAGGMQTNVLIGGALLFGDLIDEKGEVPVPVVGKVKIAGLTLFQAQDTLQRIANRYLPSTTVKVRLMNYHVTFLGEVLKEGMITVPNNRVSLPEAIGLAGGLAELADRSNIKIIRQFGGRVEIQYVDLLKEDFINSPYYYVHQNDVIVVPPLRQRPARLYFVQNLSIILSVVSIGLLIISLRR